MGAGESAELRVAVSRDYDDDCAVDVILESGAFRGASHIWLHIEDVVQFVSECERLAASSSGNACLSGGIGGLPMVSLELRPHGARGHILVSAELSSGEVDPDAKIYVESRVSAGLITEPAQLEQFAKGLRSIPQGSGAESIIRGSSAA